MEKKWAISVWIYEKVRILSMEKRLKSPLGIWVEDIGMNELWWIFNDF